MQLNLNAGTNANGSEYSLPPSYRAPLVHHTNSNANCGLDTSVGTLDQTFTSSTSITSTAQPQQPTAPPSLEVAIQHHPNELIEVSQTKSTSHHRISSAAVDVHNNNNNTFVADGLALATKTKAIESAAETNVDDLHGHGQVEHVIVHMDVGHVTSDGSDAITLITAVDDATGTATGTPTTTMAAVKRRPGDLVTIVTISGCTETESSTGEMDILAHL